MKTNMTHIVNGNIQASRFQSVKIQRNSQGLWVLEFLFYPFPGFLYVFQQQGRPFLGISEKRQKNFKGRSSHPLTLYMKAHFLNRRVLEVKSVDEESLSFIFAPDRAECRFCFGKHFECRLILPEPDKAPFSKTLKLGAFSIESSSEKEPPNSSLSKVDRRLKRLEKNLNADWEQSLKKDEILEALYTQLIQEDTVETSQQSFYKAFLERHKLKEDASKGLILNLVHREQKKNKKTQRHLKQRIEHLKKNYPQEQARIEKKYQQIQEGILRVKKKEAPSMRFRSYEIEPGLIAYVGRSAQENELLFKAARDRDLWFHVRDFPGAHVWLSRQQETWKKSPQQEAKAEWIRVASLLALFYSKAPFMSSAVVDHTEKRYLRKVPKQKGMLRLLRSETCIVKGSLLWEKRFKGKDSSL